MPEPPDQSKRPDQPADDEPLAARHEREADLSSEGPVEQTLPDSLDGHEPDGLDLARQSARAVAKARPATGDPSARRRTPRRGRGRRAPGSRVSGAFPDDRDPQTLENLVGRLVEDHGWAVDLRIQGIFARWAELVGAEVSEHCRPDSFSDGKLLVQTDSTAWATQLRLLAPTLQRRLNEELGTDTVRTVEVRGPAAPSWRKGRRRVPGKGPGDTYG